MSQRITKVAKFRILKPAGDMTWDELGKLMRDTRYRVFRLANLAVSEAYLEFHKKRNNPDLEIERKKISQLNKELRNLLEEEESKAKKISNFAHEIFSKEGALPSNVVYALSQYKIKAEVGSGKWGDILRGRKSLPTYKLNIAIPVRCDDLPGKKSRKRMERAEDGNVEVDLMICLQPYPRVVIATGHKALGASQSVILERMLDNKEQSEDGYRQRCFEIKQDLNTKKWHLLVTYDFPKPEPKPLSTDRIVGVDLGFSCPVYAATNCGLERLGRRQFTALGARIKSLQYQTIRRRRDIQRGGNINISGERARSGHGRKRKLKPVEKLEGRINNAYTTLNHQLSTAVINFALNHGAGIIQMEDLSNLAETLSGTFIGANWRYAELQRFIMYKAEEVGIETFKVNPCHTSRRCSKCGFINAEFTRGFRDKNKKKGMSTKFICPECGFDADADYNAARNLATLDIANIIKAQAKKQGIDYREKID